ncbi:glycosyltransferase family 4 protein [Patescibacteria group bacterium]|nr:glycosyltransferase family 4 protein [Patescibacteria group bacterium]
MKIAFVNDTFLEGRGADVVIYELARRLGKKHKVYVIASEANIKEENFEIILIKAKKLFTGNSLESAMNYFPNLRKFKKEILKIQKKYQIEVFNVHHSALNNALKGLPRIVTWHGTPPSRNKLRIFFNRFLLRKLKKNKITITISDYMKNELSLVIPEKKIKKIYNGISEEFKPKIKGYDKGYMLYVGRFEQHKRVQDLIKLSKETNFPLHLCGSGPLEKELREYAQNIQAKKVIFLGKVPREDLIKQYQQCSFFVSGSIWEGFGLIFIEAAACKKAAVGYKKGSIPEVISNKKSGFVVKNFNEFKKKVKDLIKNKKLRYDMGKNALKFSKNFGWDKAAAEYEMTFREILNEETF